MQTFIWKANTKACGDCRPVIINTHTHTHTPIDGEQVLRFRAFQDSAFRGTKGKTNSFFS